ncbi:MAG: hypothetical protein LH468_01655, partial [Nocardioides sp.]|nr:hypothetical protein [Nocardioides sp.]
ARRTPPSQPEPAPAPGPGSRSSSPRPPAYGASYGEGQQAAAVAPPPVTDLAQEDRPATLVWACVVTWIFTGLAAALMSMVALALVAVPDLYEEVSRQTPELAEQGITEAQVVTTAVVSTVVVLAWSALATFFAVQLWRRRSWAPVALLASAAAAGLLSVLGALASALLVVPLAACAAVVVLLCRAEVRWWLR